MSELMIGGQVATEFKGTPPTPGPLGAFVWDLKTGHLLPSRKEAVRLAYQAPLLGGGGALIPVSVGSDITAFAAVLSANPYDGPKACAGGAMVRIAWRLALTNDWVLRALGLLE